MEGKAMQETHSSGCEAWRQKNSSGPRTDSRRNSSQDISRSSEADGDDERSTGLGKCYSLDPKPWSGKVAKLQVITPPRGVAYRRKVIQEQKEAMGNIMQRSPHVEISWLDGMSKEVGTKSQALIDTGADWTLIDNREVTPEEREQLTMEEPGLEGRGVSGEKIDIVGVIWRSLMVGDLMVHDQRFVVVRNMTSDVILGSDFWNRVSPIQIDFGKRTLTLCSGTATVEIHEGLPVKGTGPQVKAGGCKVQVVGKWVVPPRTEALVKCKAKGLVPGDAYLLEPVRGEEDRFGVPYSIVQQPKASNQTFWVKVVNMNEVEEELGDGYIVGNIGEVSSIHQPAGSQSCSNSGKLPESLSLGVDLSQKQRLQLTSVLDKYEDVFFRGGPLPLVNVGIEHTIRKKPDTAPIACRPRRLSPEGEMEVRKEIEKLLDMKVIRVSNSPWAAPVVCARRSDGSLRLALDYRRVNEVSDPATLHPIPLIEDLLDRLATAKYYSVLDAKSGYHQMPLKGEDSEVTAFVVPWGQYEWAERCPFGLKGAGYSFQRMMATMLGASNFVEALCYLDDILIWGETWEVHLERLEKVLVKVRGAGLALSPEKCRFGVSEVVYLGSVIKNGMVSISEQRVQDLRNLPTPSTVKELRRVLGAFSFIQRWLPGIAEVAKPLNTGVKGKPHSKLAWTVEMNQAFNKLKRLVAEATALKIPNHEERFTLITDCSDVGAGAVLTQMEGENRVPVAFYHHTLTPAEQKYHTTDKELLAVVLGVKKFRVYLTKQFDLITDHQAVRWLSGLNIHDEKGRRGRWVEFLQQYDMGLIHKSGRSPELSMADYLSRVAHEKVGFDEEKLTIWAASMATDTSPKLSESIEVSQIMERQRKCPNISYLIDCLARRKAGGSDEDLESVDLKRLRLLSDSKDILERAFIDERGVVMIRFNGGRRTEQSRFGVKERNRILLPIELTEEALKVCHSAGLGGHMGMDRTWWRVRNAFYWKGMRSDVDEFVRDCELCATNKHSTHPNVAPFQETDLPDTTLDHLQIDFMGPFPAAVSHPFRYVLQIQDILSRFLLFLPTHDDQAQTAATVVMNHWICIFGTPTTANSDRGTHFTGEVFEALCKMVGIKHKLGAPKHPESQGQCERQNQLMAQIRCMCENDVEKWPEAVYRVAFAHNASKSATTGIAPMELVFGHEVRTPEVAWLRDDRVNQEGAAEKITGGGSYMTELVESKEKGIAEMISRAREKTRCAQLKRMEEQATRGRPYMVGDLVRVKLDSYEVLKKGKKLARKYSGKYRVVEVFKGGWTYRLIPLGWKGRIKIRHFNELKDAGERQMEEENSDSEAEFGSEARKPKRRKDNPSEIKTPVLTVDLEESKSSPVVEKALEKTRGVVVRRSGRERRPPQRLEMGEGKRYKEYCCVIPEESSPSECEESFDLDSERSDVETSEGEKEGEGDREMDC